MRSFAERRELLDTARKLIPLQLTTGTSGNVSRRTDGGMVITPSGMPYDAVTLDDLVDVRLDGGVPGRQRTPSSEWRIHRDLYLQRREIGAVVHAHPPFATAIACHRRGIPAFHYMVAKAGGNDIRCARYETYGTPELSQAALQALAGRRACLLANHGLITVGADLTAALELAVEVETLAGQYLRALQLGEPVLLDDTEMQRVVEKFRGYGQPTATVTAFGKIPGTVQG